MNTTQHLLRLAAVGTFMCPAVAWAGEVNTSALSQNGWYSDDTRADGTGTEPAGTNLISDTLTDDPEATASGTAAHDADINAQIVFGPAPGVVPAGTFPGAVHLQIGPSGSGKSQISHRKDDGTGHGPGSVFGSGFAAEYSWMGDGTVSVTPSLKFGIKTAEYGSTGASPRTGENVWDKVLIYEPGNLNGGTSDGLWHTDTITYTSGKWWFFDRTAGAGTIGTPMTLSDMSTSGVLVGGGPKTIADVYALITAAGAHITSVQVGIGSGNSGGSVYVNQVETNFYRAGDVTTFGPDGDRDVTPEVIFGSGNLNGSFTVDRQASVELGLRGKLRYPASNIFNSNGDGTYTFNTGSGTGAPPNSEWSFEWTVNTDYDDSSSLTVGDLTYAIGMDNDPGPGTDYLVFDMITPGSALPYTPPSPPSVFWDHAFGDNSTINGGGVSAGDGPTYDGYLSTLNVAQNSWRPTFFQHTFPYSWDPDVPGRYEYYVAAFDAGVEVARTAISIIAVDGATLSLEADPCQPDQDLGKAGLQIEVELWMRNPDDLEVTGWAAFLNFDDTELTYEGACSSYSPSPFGSHFTMIEDADFGLPAGELRLDGNTFAATGPDGDALLATLVFTVADVCDPVLPVTFDLTQPFPSELSYDGDPIATDLLDGPSIVVDDGDPPAFTFCPTDITQPADAGVGGGCESAVVTWSDPVATDTCSSVSVQCVPTSGSVFPVGITTVTCTATDGCGNTSVCEFDVEVTETNLVSVVVDLVGTSTSPTRCIHFVLNDCVATADVSLDFTSGMYVGDVEVPCGMYDAICAKDQQHSEWGNALLVLSGDGTKYELDPGTPSLVLLAGDTDNDGDCDINDVTLFLAQFGGPEPVGSCPWTDTSVRGADFNNDGTVGTGDYTLLSDQWLTVSDCDGCGPLVFGGPGAKKERPAASIATSRIDARLAKRADLNHDGLVDFRDVRIFEGRHGFSDTLSTAIMVTDLMNRRER